MCHKCLCGLKKKCKTHSHNRAHRKAHGKSYVNYVPMWFKIKETCKQHSTSIYL